MYMYLQIAPNCMDNEWHKYDFEISAPDYPRIDVSESVSETPESVHLLYVWGSESPVRTILLVEITVIS